MPEDLQKEIEREIAADRIVIFGKGTKTAPRCGFTLETIEFFNRYGYPFAVIDVLENMPKREALSQLTDWPTLPKVFINGKFYGDTDVLEPMAASGELKAALDEAFDGTQPEQKQTINLH